MRLGILELVTQFAGGVEGIDVDLHRARPEYRRGADREGRDVRQHQGDSVAALDADARVEKA